MAEVTDEQRQAANNLTNIANYNAQSTKNQLSQQLANYDLADKQNRALADTERNQSSKSSAADRFAQNKKLQNATRGLLGTVGNGLYGSTLYNIMDMLRSRQDLDNQSTLNTLQQNWDTAENAYNESANSNVLARNDAASNAEYALRGIQSDTAAQLNNINPNLFVSPGEGDTNVGADGTYDANKREGNFAKMSGYIMPSQNQIEQQTKPRSVSKTSYFNKLMNRYRG
nr:MAG TPA: hypothetical protein [Caudoviricetes sp.]